MGPRRAAPATERNARHIARVLARVLPRAGTVLEIASGTGQHAARLAQAFPTIAWQPSDPDPASRASIAAWRVETGPGAGMPLPPLDIDVCTPGWETAVAGPWAGLVCINMIHIAPWAACEGLMRGAGRRLGAGAPLYLYGPYRRNGRHTAPSNAAFDDSLRGRDATWGVRDLEAVAACAERNGLALARVVLMPANNLSVVFRRA